MFTQIQGRVVWVLALFISLYYLLFMWEGNTSAAFAVGIVVMAALGLMREWSNIELINFNSLVCYWMGAVVMGTFAISGTIIGLEKSNFIWAQIGLGMFGLVREWKRLKEEKLGLG